MSDHLTPYQQLRALRDSTGLNVQLRPFDRLDKIIVKPGVVAVFITTHRVRETRSSITLTHQGIRMISYTAQPDGTTSHTDQTLWDPDFRPVMVDGWGTRSLSDYRDKLAWEGMCGRPGQGRLGQRDLDQVQREVMTTWNRVFGASNYELNGA